jgi:hypothetical protein
MIEAFPLQWPVGWKRTLVRGRSRFDKSKLSFGKVRDFVIAEVGRMGGSKLVINSNLNVRRDGLPYANQAEPGDPGIAIYFTRNGKAMCFGCDCYTTVRENLYSIGKTIEALRGIERWGASDMMERAFTGFAALPETTTRRDWWDVLGVRRDASMGTIEDAYRQLAKALHPDMPTGSHEAMSELNTARERALKEVRR